MLMQTVPRPYVTTMNTMKVRQLKMLMLRVRRKHVLSKVRDSSRLSGGAKSLTLLISRQASLIDRDPFCPSLKPGGVLFPPLSATSLAADKPLNPVAEGASVSGKETVGSLVAEEHSVSEVALEDTAD